MKATIEITVQRVEVVPSGSERVAWLDQHGVVPERITVACSAELADWSAAGCSISDDGTVVVPAYNQPLAQSRCKDAVIARLRGNPQDTSEMDATTVLRARAEELRAEAEREAARKASEQREAEAIAARIAAVLPDDVMMPDGSVRRYETPGSPEVAGIVRAYLMGGGGYAGGDRAAMAARLATDAIDALIAEQRARKERSEKAKEEGRALLRAWVAGHGAELGLPPNVIRAARDGKEVSGALSKTLRDRIEAAISLLIPEDLRRAGLGSIPSTYQYEASYRVPSEQAYQIRDAIEAGLQTIVEAAALPGAVAKVLDFCRVDVSAESDTVWRGAIDVEVTHPWLPGENLGTYVLTERHRPPRDDD